MTSQFWAGVGVSFAFIFIGFFVVRQLNLHLTPRLDARLAARREARARKRLVKNLRLEVEVAAAAQDPSYAAAALSERQHRVIVELIVSVAFGIVALASPSSLVSVPALVAAVLGYVLMNRLLADYRAVTQGIKDSVIARTRIEVKINDSTTQPGDDSGSAQPTPPE